MNRQRIFSYLDVLRANRASTKTRKMKDELKGALLDELDRPENADRVYACVLDDYAYQRFMSVSARRAGFGLGDVAEFLTWLFDELDIRP